ncbi:CobB/CobQ-like protein [Streptococcus pneumoniae PNI0427]|nr:CobB/CobQ-like protein [Streptococcus pneumoniae PNI0427]
MVYTSLSSKDGNYPYQLNIAHLYGNLMNTYGDNGNILMLKYVAEKLGAHVTVDIVSLHDDFDENHYDIAFFGGGQDFEQSIIADDLPAKKESIDNYIQNDGVVLAICGGFQLLGQYYVEASGKRIEGLGVMGHYTLNQTNNRFIGDIKIHNEDFDETYYGFENHQGRTFLSDDQKPLGQVVYGNGNNEEKVGEGVHYKNVFGSYFHGPILSRNANLAYRLVTTALKKKYGQDIQLPAYEDILSQEIAEEYSDVQKQGCTFLKQRKMISKNSVILSEFFVFSFTLLPCIFSHFLPK